MFILAKIFARISRLYMASQNLGVFTAGINLLREYLQDSRHDPRQDLPAILPGLLAMFYRPGQRKC